MSWVLIKCGEDHSNFSQHGEWQLDSAQDIESPPAEAQNAAPGSLAWLGDFSKIWNKQNDGTWAEVLGGE